MNSLRQIQGVSIGDFRKILASPEMSVSNLDLDFADVVYLAQAVFADELTTQEKQRFLNVAIRRESTMKYTVVGCWAKNPYLLKKNIELAQLYFSNDIYADYWESIWKALYQTLVQLYGHDLYSIQKVPVYALRAEIMDMMKLPGFQWQIMLKDNYPEESRHLIVSYFLDKLDLWYLANHHPQKNDISEKENRFLADYIRSHYAELSENMQNGNLENEYHLRKCYFAAKSMADEKLTQLYGSMLNRNFKVQPAEMMVTRFV